MNTNLPMLPHRSFPSIEGDGGVMQSLTHALLEGTVDWKEAMNLFYIPGIGFHQSGYYLLCHSVGYLGSGRHTVAVSSHMQDALAHTSLAGVALDDLHMPHQTMYFALPDSKFQLWGGETGWHDCVGVYVSAANSEPDSDSNDPDSLKFYFWGIENENSSCEGDDASFWLSLNLQMMRETGWDFDTYIDHILSTPENEVTMREITPHGVEDMRRSDGTHIKDIHRLARIVINAMLYINCEDAVVEHDEQAAAYRKEAAELASAYARIKNKSKSKARRIQKRLSQIPRDHIMWIGSSTPTTNAETTFVSEGSWYPRRDVLRRKIKDTREEMDTQFQEQNKAYEGLHTAQEVEEIANAVANLHRLTHKSVEQETQLDDLQNSLCATRRWIQPRVKGG